MRITTVLTVTLLVAFLAAPLAAADPFYESLHEEGVQALARGDAPRAAKVLRLACFGLLEEPVVLARCLARLAVAQGDLGRVDDFRETFGRVANLEQRFGAFSKSELRGDLRRRFENHAEKTVLHENLLQFDTFRHIAMRQMTASPAEGLARAEPPSALRSAFEEARRAMASGSIERVRQTFQAFRGLVDQHRDNPRVQHLGAELAYRARLWDESRQLFERGGPIDPQRADLAFYYAVVLFETGEVTSAQRVLESCLPRLTPSDYINEYARRIQAGG